MFDPPEAELQSLRDSWAKVSAAAAELREGLRDSGPLRRELLLTALEDHVGPLSAAFPPPEGCHSFPGAAQWSMQGTFATLLSPHGIAETCNTRTGQVEHGDAVAVDLKKGDLGSFLDVLIAPSARAL